MDNIKGFLETSFIDWPGRSCAVLFLGGCNFRCPFCHNHPLVLEPGALVSRQLEEIMARLRPLRGWLGGICVSGGEPTLTRELPELLHCLKAEGFQVKLDTNGSRPAILAGLLGADLLDMVAMDVKAPLEQELYDGCCGVPVDLDAIRESIKLLRETGVAHQFRMTVVPGFHDRAAIQRWCRELGDYSNLKLQNYKPHSVLDPELAGGKIFSDEAFADLIKLLPPMSP